MTARPSLARSTRRKPREKFPEESFKRC
uniref:Uncharacterized protein n=1 Tax=Rhizophora mucronata TaxID=61149 RepID=A0A2P2J4G3_RHIMU